MYKINRWLPNKPQSIWFTIYRKSRIEKMTYRKTMIGKHIQKNLDTTNTRLNKWNAKKISRSSDKTKKRQQIVTLNVDGLQMSGRNPPTPHWYCIIIFWFCQQYFKNQQFKQQNSKDLYELFFGCCTWKVYFTAMWNYPLLREGNFDIYYLFSSLWWQSHSGSSHSSSYSSTSWASFLSRIS